MPSVLALTQEFLHVSAEKGLFSVPLIERKNQLEEYRNLTENIDPLMCGQQVLHHSVDGLIGANIHRFDDECVTEKILSLFFKLAFFCKISKGCIDFEALFFVAS